MQDNLKEPQSSNKTVVIVNNSSWLKQLENFAGKELVGYGDLDIEKAPDLKDEEYYKYLAEERKLREQLRQIDIWERSSAEVAQMMSDNNLEKTLLKWAEVHLRNKAIQMKRGDSDILIVPTTQVLLEAAIILSENK